MKKILSYIKKDWKFILFVIVLFAILTIRLPYSIYAPGGKKLICVNSACYAFQDKDKYDKYWEIEHLAALIKTGGDWKKQMKIYGWI